MEYWSCENRLKYISEIMEHVGIEASPFQLDCICFLCSQSSNFLEHNKKNIEDARKGIKK